MNEAEHRRLAAVEDRMWYFRGLHALLEQELLLAAVPAKARLLDAGCGTGGLIRRMARRHPGWSWTGIDVSPLACALAREKAGDVAGSDPSPGPGQASDPRAATVTPRIEEAAVEKLPFGGGAFDAATCADVLYHLQDDIAALREIGRVLAPGGVLIATAPAHAWLWSYHDEAVGGRRRYAKADLAAHVAAAGFVVERIVYWNALVFPALIVRRKLWPAPGAASDVREFPAWCEAAGRAALTAERAWLRHAPLPIGASLLVRARRGQIPRLE